MEPCEIDLPQPCCSGWLLAVPRHIGLLTARSAQPPSCSPAARPVPAHSCSQPAHKSSPGGDGQQGEHRCSEKRRCQCGPCIAGGSSPTLLAIF